jgi:hypothetical protein
LSNAFPVRNGLKQVDALLPLIFNFAVEYTIRKFQELKEGLDLNQHISCWSKLMVLIYWVKTNITKKSTEALLGGSKEVCLEVNAEKTKCMFMSRHQTTDKNRYVNAVYKYFENVAKFKYL